MGGFSVTLPRVSNSLRSQLLLANLNQTSVNLLRKQSQISSGRRILSPSDDPFDAAIAGQIKSFLAQKMRFQTNIQNAFGVLSTADGALGQASDIINQAYTIGLEEIGVIATEETRRSAAAIIDELTSELVSLGNTRFAGRYIFAGRDTLTAPFENHGQGIYFRGDTGEVSVSIDYSSASSTSVDAAGAFGAVSAEISGTRDLDPAITGDTLLGDLNGGRGVKPGSITISDGTNVSTIDLSHAATVGDVLAAINAGTPPSTTASIRPDGKGLMIEAPGGNLHVTNALGGSTATDLGIFRPSGAGEVLTGDDVDPVVTLLTPLSAIEGVDWAGGMQIRNGSLEATLDFSGCLTVQDVLQVINLQGLYIEARINDAGTGIDIVSRLSGGALEIGENGGTTASDLGVRSMDLSTVLSSLNGGRGVSTADGIDMTITLSDGTSFGVDISGAVTLSDVLDAINTAADNPGTLSASLNDFGNGIVLGDSSGGAGELSVVRANMSNAAADLGILGSTAGAVLEGQSVRSVEPGGVFSHLLGLKKALLANDDAGISFYTGRLQDDLPRLLESRASLGARQQRMETVKDRISNEVLELKGMLSDRMDLDYSEAIVKYSTLQASFEAGLQTAGSLLQMSLLDFLR